MSNERIWETAFEDMPPLLFEQLGPLEAFPLSRQDLVAMGQMTPGFLAAIDEAGIQPVSFDGGLIAAIDKSLPRPDRQPMFPRLGIASFKTQGPPPPVWTAQDLFRVITRPNPRLSAFLVDMVLNGRKGTLYLRPWLPLLPWGEFRVFVMEGQVAGVTQYPLRMRCPEIATYEAQIRIALRQLFETVMPVLHLPTAVLDVGMTVEEGALKAHLLELNPAIRRTDAGLFDWVRHDFDRSFRYL